MQLLGIAFSLLVQAHAQTFEEGEAMKQQLRRLRAPEGWIARKGGPMVQGHGVTVAVIDSGVNAYHQDLAANIAKNLREIPGNKTDDDKNGLVDDVAGWDFYMNSSFVPDMHGHGSHVAGIIAGKRYGIAPQAKILPIRVAGMTGALDVNGVMKGITYAADRGARVINLSLGGLDLHDLTRPQYEKVVRHARDKGVLLVVAAGNDGMDNNRAPVYPANVMEDNVVTVCSVDANNILSSFSNFGSLKVSLCAYGEEIISAGGMPAVHGLYQAMSGTSMAAPAVAGVAALVLEANPKLMPYEVRQILVSSATKLPQLAGTSLSEGVVDAGAAVRAALLKGMPILRPLQSQKPVLHPLRR